MSIAALAEISKVAGAAAPGVGAAGEAVVKMLETIEQVKVHKQRCKYLRNQCVETLNALKESTTYVEGSSEMKEAIDVFEAKVLKIHRKMEDWASLSLMRSIVKQNEISIGLDQLSSDLATSTSRFQIAGMADIARAQQETRLVYEKDAAELREQLLTLVRQQDTINSLLTNTSDVKQVMQTIQEEIQQEEMRPVDSFDRDRRDLEETLYYLHKEADVLPPITDLTHEVQKLSEHAVAHGGGNDIYIGEWLGQERVALKFTRGCNHSEIAKKKFYHEVSIWRNLQHPNIVRLYGTATFGNYIYTVSPWMDNGDALQFLQHNPDHDRKRLILEVAQGLNYLHGHRVAHGDLRCANILISRNRVARISDFGMSILVGDIAEETGTHLDMSLAGVRWRAPELIDPPPGTKIYINAATDVWSFGMLCLEVMTEERPYHALGMTDVSIVKLIGKGVLPERPIHGIGALFLDDSLWQIILSCWQSTPDQRSSMEQVVNRLKRKLSGITSEVLTASPGSSPNMGSLAISQADRGMRRQTDSPNFRDSASSIFHPLQTVGVPRSRRSTNSSSSAIFERGHPLDGNSPPRRGIAIPTQPDFPRSPDSLSIPANLSMQQPTPPSSAGSGITASSPLRRTGDVDYRTNSLSSSSGLSFMAPKTREFSLSITPPSVPDLQSHMSGQGHQRFGTTGSSFTAKSPEPLSNTLPHVSSNYAIHVAHEKPYMLSDSGLHLDRQGAIIAGTLPSLIRRLLTETDALEQDLQFRETFLTCYRAFSSESELYQSLETHYRLAEEEASLDEGGSLEARYLVLMVLRLWLSNTRFYYENVHVLEVIKSFAESIASPTRLKRQADQLLEVIRTKEQAIQRPVRWDEVHSSRVYEGFKASSARPLDFAIGFTILAWDIYSALTRTDFVLWLIGHPGGEPVQRVLCLWDKLSYWTRHMILLSESEKVRTARLQLFVGIASECRRLRNFMCMAAIASACSSQWISRLKHTFGDLDKTSKETLKSISSLLDSHDNFRNYKDEVTGLARQKKALVPDPAIHSRDLKSLWGRSSSHVQVNHESFINFRKYTAVNDQIRNILSYQTPPIDLERYRETGALAYLECQLESFAVTEEVKLELESRALQLQRDEERAYVTREREVREAGFRTKRAPRRPSS